MDSEREKRINEVQASAWQVLSTYATMAKREFDAMTPAQKWLIPNIHTMLDYIEGRKEAVDKFVDSITP